jgi:hypothetical protein
MAFYEINSWGLGLWVINTNRVRALQAIQIKKPPVWEVFLCLAVLSFKSASPW